MRLNNIIQIKSWDRVIALSLIAFLSGAMTSCSSKDKLLSRTEQCQADMTESKSLLADEDYQDARINLNAVLANCTGTGFMEDAQYHLAESYFQAEEWIDAYGEYNIFLNQYPSSPSAPMAFYKKGLSAWSQEYVPGRDETYTNDAIKAFNEFIRVYPENAKVDSAQYYMSDLIERLADRELATAVLYLKMREPQATAIYLQQFLKDFPNSSKKPKAYALLVESYTRLDQFQEAEKYLHTMRETLDKEKYADQIAELASDLKEKQEDYQEELEDSRIEKLKQKDNL